MTVTPDIQGLCALGFSVLRVFHMRSDRVLATRRSHRNNSCDASVSHRRGVVPNSSSHHDIDRRCLHSRLEGHPYQSVFYERLFEKIRDREHVDVDLLFKDASTRSAQDIKVFLKDATVWSEWGGFKQTMMGIWSFLWLWISYAIFYGIAGLIGESMRHYPVARISERVIRCLPFQRWVTPTANSPALSPPSRAGRRQFLNFRNSA